MDERDPFRSPRHVTLRRADGGEEECVLHLETVFGPSLPYRHRMRAEAPSLGVLEAEGWDLFEALRALRRQLDPTGARLLCQGARPDVLMRAMSSQAGGALVYVIRMGRTPSRSDLVHVLDPAPPEAVGSVEEQDRFLSDWSASVF